MPARGVGSARNGRLACHPGVAGIEFCGRRMNRVSAPPPLPPEFEDARLIPGIKESADASLRVDSVIARVPTRIHSFPELQPDSWYCLKVLRCKGDAEKMWLAASRGVGSVPPHPAIARFMGCSVCREVNAPLTLPPMPPFIPFHPLFILPFGRLCTYLSIIFRRGASTPGANS